MSVLFIAEAGVNHNGSAERALEMVEVAARCGADAVKFQTFSADLVVGRNAEKAAYQKKQTGEGSQYDMIKALEMSPELHERLVVRCGEIGIEFMSTAFDEGSADLLVGLGIRRIKIPSGEITNFPLLRHFASFDLPMIMSTGMATMGEIEEALQVLGAAREAHGYFGPLREMVTILHCTSNYPADVGDANLLAMLEIGKVTGHPIGYSDHTLGCTVSTAAVALGATVIEKHFTLDASLPGPDHRASSEPDELKRLIDQVRDVERALGSPEKGPVDAELNVRDVARRSVVARAALPAGHALAEADLALMRPGTGIQPRHFDALVGRRLAVPKDAGSPLAWDDLLD